MGVITADQLGLVGRTVVSLVGAVVLVLGLVAALDALGEALERRRRRPDDPAG